MADLRKQNWAELIPESVLHKELKISVHLSRDIAVGGNAAIAGAAVFTHSNVPEPLLRQSLLLYRDRRYGQFSNVLYQVLSTAVEFPEPQVANTALSGPSEVIEAAPKSKSKKKW